MSITDLKLRPDALERLAQFIAAVDDGSRGISWDDSHNWRTFSEQRQDYFRTVAAPILAGITEDA